MKFRDVRVAPNSDLARALEAGQTIKALEIYLECEYQLIMLEQGVTKVQAIAIYDRRKRP